MEISTRNLVGLPDIIGLKRLLQAMAMLDAIIEPEWEYRYYSFNAHWDLGEMMGSMRNGEGDDFFALFNTHGAFLKGLDHESEAAQVPSDRLYQGLPPQFEPCMREPAFGPDTVSFCVWRLSDQHHWSCTKLDLAATHDFDGSAHMLSMFDGVPETYQAWATEYYERDISLRSVTSVYAHHTLSDELVAALNPKLNVKLLQADIVEIGYPAR